MPGDFDVKFDELMAEIGRGVLKATVTFDQAYAKRQHEDMSFKHPHGGGPQYLRRALYEYVDEYMTIIAGRGLTNVKQSMTLVAEELARHASDNAPKRTAHLSNSDHATCTDNGVTYYDRPAPVGRLGPEDIEALNMELQDPHHYYGEWPPPVGVGAIYERVRRSIRRSRRNA